MQKAATGVGKLFSDVYNPTQTESQKFSFWRCGLFACHMLILLIIFGILLGIGFGNRGIVKEERFNIKADGFKPKDGEVCLCETTTYSLSTLMPNFNFLREDRFGEDVCQLPPYEQCNFLLGDCFLDNLDCTENCDDCRALFIECQGNALADGSCEAKCQRNYQDCSTRYCDFKELSCMDECIEADRMFPGTIEFCADSCSDDKNDCVAHFCQKRLFECYQSCNRSFCDFQTVEALSFFLQDEISEIPDVEIVTIPHYLTRDEYYDFLEDYFQKRADHWARSVILSVTANLLNVANHQCSISRHSLCESYHRLSTVVNNQRVGKRGDEFVDALAEKIFYAGARAIQTQRISYDYYLDTCEEVDCLLLKDEPAFDIIFNAVGTAGGFNGLLFTIFATLYIPILHWTRKRTKETE